MDFTSAELHDVHAAEQAHGAGPSTFNSLLAHLKGTLRSTMPKGQLVLTDKRLLFVSYSGAQLVRARAERPPPYFACVIVGGQCARPRCSSRAAAAAMTELCAWWTDALTHISALGCWFLLRMALVVLWYILRRRLLLRFARFYY